MFTLHGDGEAVTVARWNEDNGRTLLATEGGFVRVYVTDMADLRELACEYATRNLTLQEWERFLPGEPFEVTCPGLP